MTKIINMVSGPGGGKSTSAAYLYYLFKSHDLNVELVREYVKSWAWEQRQVGPYDQIYFCGKQVRKESMLFGKVDYIITDSPVILGVHYARRYSPKHVVTGVEDSVKSFYRQTAADGHKHINISLIRTEAYNQAGRYQTLDQAKEIDVALNELMTEYGMQYTVSGIDSTSLNKVFYDITGIEHK